jgi:valyl-tRNA synthetase
MQDEDVLDTWFSSWLWPIASFDGINTPDNPDINYYYPTSDLITAPDILFFWVARMIIAGYEFRGEKPFKNVYLTGLVRDQQRRKMSKSLGNSPEPLDLVEKYGADGVRVGILLCSPAGNDLLFDDSLPEQGRNFANKIWNAFRLLNGWTVDERIEQPGSSAMAVKCMEEVLKKGIAGIESDFRKFRISAALMTVYKLFWDEFSGWYLEIIKPAYGQPVDKTTYDESLLFLDNLLRLIHPFMPFITEEIWQLIGERKDGESIMISSMPVSKKYNRDIVERYEKAKETITAIRSVRMEKGIPARETIELRVRADEQEYDTGLLPVIVKLCNISGVMHVSEKQEGAASFMIGTTEFYIPLGERLDAVAELVKVKEELEYHRGFLDAVMKKLDNERFVANAPVKVLELEKKKRADAEMKIKALEARMEELKKI